MNSAPPSPELCPGEPHPAVRLAEAVCALIAAIAGPSWFWRFLPGGRAFWAQMHRMGQDFAALMHRLAAAPPLVQAAPISTLPRRRQSARTGKARPRRALPARAPRRTSAPTPRAPPPGRHARADRSRPLSAQHPRHRAPPTKTNQAPGRIA